MSNQRVRLAKYENKRQFYHAVFGEIRHDKNNQPEVLLKDIYPIYPNGKKVPLRSKPELKDDKGEQIAADHAWVKLNIGFLNLPYELLNGDQIVFSAVVKTYPIVRQNVLKSRDMAWNSGQQKAEQVYEDYQHFKNTVAENLYQEMKKSQEKAYAAYKKHILTFDEMQKAQKDAYRLFKNTKHKAYNSMQAKQKRRIKHAQKDIAQINLVDYELTDLQNIKIVDHITKFDIFRKQYDKTRLNDLSYTKFLAAHSMAASKGYKDLAQFDLS